MNQATKPADIADGTPMKQAIVAVKPQPRQVADVRATPGGALHVENIDGMWRFATALAKSTALPKSLVAGNNLEATTANVFLAIQYGAEVGIPPMQAVQTIAVINGMPSLWGDGMKAVVRMSGVCKYITEGIAKDAANPADHTKWVAWCESERADTGEKRREEFSWGDAMRAGLTGKETYQKYPQRMLPARARSWCLRDLFPDYLKGLRSAEEMIEVDGQRGADGTWKVEPVGDRPTVDDGRVLKSEDGPEPDADSGNDGWALDDADGVCVDVIPDGPKAAEVVARRLHTLVSEAPLNAKAVILAANDATIARLREVGMGDAVDAIEALAEPEEPKAAESPAKPAGKAPAKAAAPEQGKTPAKAAAPEKATAPAAKAEPTEADIPPDDRPAYDRIKGRLERAGTRKGLGDIWQYEVSHGELSTLAPVTQALLQRVHDTRASAAR